MNAIARDSRPLKLSSGAVMMLAGLALSVIAPPVAASDREGRRLAAPYPPLEQGRLALTLLAIDPPRFLNCDFNGDFLHARQECAGCDEGSGNAR